MAFSFIRKIIAPNTSGNITLENESDAAPIVAEESGFDLSQLSIEVIDNDSLLTPIQEEAAMLHASGQSIAAAKILHSELKKIAGLHQTEAWLMLFELLQQNNDKQLFDKVALLFVLEFEKTPPTWRQHSVKASSEAQNYYQFPAILSHSNIDKELLAFQAALQACSSLRIDMAKIKEIDTIAAAELLAVWQRSVKKGIRLQLLGNHEIETLLRSRIQTGRAIPAEAPLWLLLIELQQIQGLQDEFENLAVDYAITFEVSPPSWIEPDQHAVLIPAGPIEPVKKQDRLYIESDILNTKPEQIAAIRDYVQQRSFPVLDFSHVHRVDFDSAGQLLGLCMDKPQQITLCHANALVVALFRIMGITELVTLSS